MRYQVRVAHDDTEHVGYRIVTNWKRRPMWSVPDEARLQPLPDIEGEPLGVMVRGHRLSDEQMLSLIAREILIPVRERDLRDPRTGQAYFVTRLYDETVDIIRTRWVGVDVPLGMLWCEPCHDAAQEPDAIVEDEFDVTVAYSEEMCRVLWLVQGTDGS